MADIINVQHNNSGVFEDANALYYNINGTFEKVWEYVEEDRYIIGREAVGENTVSFFINEELITVDVDEYGEWRYDIPPKTKITSLKNMFNYEETGSLIYDVDFSHIGNVSKCTSFENAFLNQAELFTITFPDTFKMPLNTSMKNAFNNCYVENLDISMFDFTNVTTAEGMINVSDKSHLYKLTLPTIPKTVIIDNNTFSFGDMFTEIYCNGTISCSLFDQRGFETLYFNNTGSAFVYYIENLINSLENRKNVYLEYSRLYVSKSVYDKLSSTIKDKAIEKFWMITY